MQTSEFLTAIQLLTATEIENSEMDFGSSIAKGKFPAACGVLQIWQPQEAVMRSGEYPAPRGGEVYLFNGQRFQQVKSAACFIDRHPDSKEDAMLILKNLQNMVPKIIFHRTKCFAVALTLAGLSISGESMGGGRFSDQGNALYKALLDELMRRGVCTDNQSCSNATQMYREDGDRIYLNMYGQTDPHLGITVATFILENGLRVTDGMPITLKVYSTPKSHEAGSIFRKKVEIIKLEVNK